MSQFLVQFLCERDAQSLEDVKEGTNVSHVLVGNEPIYYERNTSNSNHTLLFVHGVGGAVESWAALRMFFTNQDSIYIDLPGHGRSSRHTFDVHDNAKMIKSFVEQMEPIDSLVYVGISYGSAVGIELATCYPDLLSGLVLISPRTHFLLTDNELENVITSVSNGDFVERGAGSMTSESMKAGMQRGMLATPPETIDQLFRKFNGFDGRADIPNIRIPTLILTGKEDGISDARDAVYLSQEIKASQLVELNTGHFISIEKPRETATAIKNFVSSL